MPGAWPGSFLPRPFVASMASMTPGCCPRTGPGGGSLMPTASGHPTISAMSEPLTGHRKDEERTPAGIAGLVDERTDPSRPGIGVGLLAVRRDARRAQREQGSGELGHAEVTASDVEMRVEQAGRDDRPLHVDDMGPGA